MHAVKNPFVCTLWARAQAHHSSRLLNLIQQRGNKSSLFLKSGRVELRDGDSLDERGVAVGAGEYFADLLLDPFVVGDGVATRADEEGLDGLLNGVVQAFEALEVEAALAEGRDVVEIVAGIHQHHSQSAGAQVFGIVGEPLLTQALIAICPRGNRARVGENVADFEFKFVRAACPVTRSGNEKAIVRIEIDARVGAERGEIPDSVALGLPLLVSISQREVKAIVMQQDKVAIGSQGHIAFATRPRAGQQQRINAGYAIEIGGNLLDGADKGSWQARSLAPVIWHFHDAPHRYLTSFTFFQNFSIIQNHVRHTTFETGRPAISLALSLLGQATVSRNGAARWFRRAGAGRGRCAGGIAGCSRSCAPAS